MFDALLMKISELHNFLHNRPRVRRELTDFADLYRDDTVKRLLHVLEGEISARWEDLKTPDDSTGRFLDGALLFTYFWHNRWATDGVQNQVLLENWKKLMERSPEQVDHRFRDGRVFNMCYHASYFDAQALAWERETSIYRWRQDKPRRGADALYESGLQASNVDDHFVAAQSAFFDDAVSHLAELGEHYSEETPQKGEAIAKLSFVLGIRAPRERALVQPFGRLLQASANWHRSARVAFWSGISRLYIHAFRESQDFISSGISALRGDIPTDTGACIEEAIERLKEQFSIRDESLSALRESVKEYVMPEMSARQAE